MKEAIVIGYVGINPEVITNHRGDEFIKFTLAAEVNKNKTDWVEVTASSSKSIELIQQYVKSGDLVMVRGYFKAHAYLNRDNKPEVSERIYLDKIKFLSSKNKGTEASVEKNVTYKPPVIDDDPAFESAL